MAYVQFSILCYEFYDFIKKDIAVSIYHYFTCEQVNSHTDVMKNIFGISFFKLKTLLKLFRTRNLLDIIK